MKKLGIFFLVVIIALGIYWKWDLILSYFKDDSLVITLNTEATDLSAYGLDLNNATRTANIYQGLVGVDRNLSIIPALAISWGNVTDTTWEFRLREGVNFQDGSPFLAQDVINAFQKAKTSNNPQIKPYTETIKDMTISENGRIIVTTFSPDPLLLSKLTKLYISKENNIGTGPYQLKNDIEAEGLTLEAFNDYWGEAPDYKTLRYTVEPNWAQRETDFQSGKTDILGAVPPELANVLSKDQIKTGYGLEVNFLMFKLDDPIFKDKAMREAVQKLIDPKKIIAIGNNFVRPATQFVAQGVFGYNQELKAIDYKADQEPRDLFGIQLQKIKLDYLASFRTLAEYLSDQLQKAGFSVTKIANTPQELLEKIQKNTSSLYLVGWQAEDGDAGSFFDTFVHSQGTFNAGRYKNPELDKLIESARQEMNPQKRLNLLKEIGAKLQPDLIGIPLFETTRLYAVQKKINWQPRLDGLILGAEVSK